MLKIVHSVWIFPIDVFLLLRIFQRDRLGNVFLSQQLRKINFDLLHLIYEHRLTHLTEPYERSSKNSVLSSSSLSVECDENSGIFFRTIATIRSGGKIYLSSGKVFCLRLRQAAHTST